MKSLAISPGAGAGLSHICERSCAVTTTFHFETSEPQYEYSCEGADVQLRCLGLVAVAAGPAHAFVENAPGTWFELSPVSGKRILAGVGRIVPSTTASALETKESAWARAMAGLLPLELAETAAALADCTYVMVDPTNGRVELGSAGHATSALILHGTGTRLVRPVPLESGAAHTASFELSAGSTLLLFTHNPAKGEAVTSAIEDNLATHSMGDDELGPFLEWCLDLRNGPLSRCDSVLALHFERLGGSRVTRGPSTPSPVSGQVLHEDVFAPDGTSDELLRRHRPHVHPGRCRSKPSSGPSSSWPSGAARGKRAEKVPSVGPTTHKVGLAVLPAHVPR